MLYFLLFFRLFRSESSLFNRIISYNAYDAKNNYQPRTNRIRHLKKNTLININRLERDLINLINRQIQTVYSGPMCNCTHIYSVYEMQQCIATKSRRYLSDQKRMWRQPLRIPAMYWSWIYSWKIPYTVSLRNRKIECSWCTCVQLVCVPVYPHKYALRYFCIFITILFFSLFAWILVDVVFRKTS